MATNGHAKFSLVSVMPIRANEGVDMQIRHPSSFELMRNADDSVVTVTMRGQTSRAFRDTVREINRQRAEQQLPVEEVQSPEHVYETDTKLLVACTVGWNFDELEPGEPFPYSEENALKLWTDERFEFLRFQAMQFLLNNGNFLPAPSTASSDTPAISSASTSPSLIQAA